MKFCELEIIQSVKRNISKDLSQETVLENAAKEIAANTGQKVEDVQQRLIESFAAVTNTVSPSSLENLRSFFTDENGLWDAVTYDKVKRKVKDLIINSMLSGRGFLVRSTQQLNASLNALVDSAKDVLEYEDDIISPLVNYFTIQAKKKSYFKMPDTVAYYLIANHLPTIIQSWMKDYISYNPENGQYSLNVKHDIRQDWQDNEDKEVELNEILNVMLEATPLYKFDVNGEVIDRNLQWRKLNRNALFAAVNDEIESMPEQDYINFLDNPYSLIDYLIAKYTNSGRHGYLYENVLHSFVYRWITDSNGKQTQFLKNSKKGLTDIHGYNPIDIFIESFNKYRSNRYLEYNLLGNTDVISLTVDENSIAYSKLDAHVSSPLFDLDDPSFYSIFIKDNKGNYTVNPNVTADQLTRVSLEVFGEHVDIDEISLNLFKDAIQQIAQFKSQTTDTSFSVFLKKISGKTKRAQKIISVLNLINAYNPYSIRGSVKNKAGKSIPIIGLSSVANTIQDNIYRNRMRLNAIKQQQNKAGVRITISPLEHTQLFKHRKGSEDNLFLRTVYRTTYRNGIDLNKDEEVKEMTGISNPEAFKLAFIEDFFKGWVSSSDSVIRIQAITPSDKPKIPFFEFNSNAIKRIYGKDNKTIERNVINELRNIYLQYVQNTVNDFIDILSDQNSQFEEELKKKANISDINNFNNLSLLDKINAINEVFAQLNITQNDINKYVFEFNKKTGLNKIIAEIHDYSIKKTSNGKKIIEISPYLIETVKFWNQDNPLDEMFKIFCKQLNDIIPNTDPRLPASLEPSKSSLWYTYFLLKNVLSENILINTVGSPLSHKYKGKDFYRMDSTAHLTMVKRMVALTATMHPCMRNVLSGLSNEINTLTFKNSTSDMFMYSGNTTSGKGFSAELENWDGAMISCRFIDNLLKQSITDTKPKGVDLKLLIHSHDAEKASAYLVKMACHSIDNNWLRCFADENVTKVGGINPLSFVQLSLEGTKIKPEFSINSQGEIIDYNGEVIYELEGYVNRNGITYYISNIKYNQSTDTFNYDVFDFTVGNVTQESCNNDLFSIWTNILGGFHSCNQFGVEGEESMDKISMLLNKLGHRLNNTELIDSQVNIDQYAKKSIIHYFPTSSVQKSLKAPTVDLNQAIANKDSRYTTKLYIDNLGIQMDPDHSAEDGNIREISQLISFIAENNYVPEKTKLIYNNLSKLIQILQYKVFVNPDTLADDEIRVETQKRLDIEFGKRIMRIFADPTLDVMGLANELMREIKNINPNLIVKYEAPYSDHQMLGKLHTTVGSYFNKFIARTWSGRGDVIMPSHNMCMIYEDENGNTYLHGDKKILSNGDEINIREYLSNLVWENKESELLNSNYIAEYKISPYEVMQTDVYYLVNAENRRVIGEPIVIDTWDKLVNVSNNIKNGMVYVRALDLPRNLRSKQAFIKITTDQGEQNIGLYHFNTIRNIAEISHKIKDIEDSKEKSEERENLIANKEKLQNYLNYVVLPAIYDGKLDIIQKELDETVLPITGVEYFVKEDERMTTNNYSNIFGIQNMNFAEILQKKENYFKEKLVERFQNIVVPNDYIMYSANGKSTIVITDENKLDTGIFREAMAPVVDEDGFRLDLDGKPLYKWTDNSKLYKYTFGKIDIDVLFTTESDLQEILKSNTFVFYRSDKTLLNKNLFNLNSETADVALDRIARKQYNSWLKSNEAILARIPSQALAFAMSMKTVAYLPWQNNVVFVPNSQLYLQGSDLDIDKVYSIMAALDRNGLFKESVNGELSIVDTNSDLGINLSDEEIEINTELANIIITNKLDKLPSLIEKISNYVKEFDLRIVKDYITNVENLIRVKGIPDEYTLKIWRRIRPSELNRRLNKVIKIIQQELIAKTTLENSVDDQKQSTQNLILETLRNIYNDPRTLFASTTPTTMDPVNDVVAEKDLEAAYRNHLNPATDIFVNQTTSVGKKGIGISAVAQKAFYALTYYYNIKYEKGESVANYFSLWPVSWNVKKIFSIGFPGQKINQKTIKDLITYFKHKGHNLDLLEEKNDFGGKSKMYMDENGIFARISSDETGEYIQIGTSKDDLKFIKIGDRIGNFIPTSINSSIISSCTDNAKEMKMDLLKATPEILPAYEFCLSIGIDLKTAAEIFTDPLIDILINISRGDLFNKELGNSRISKILNSKKYLKRIEQQYAVKLRTSIQDDNFLDSFKHKINILKKLFDGAEELTNLGQLLGINQGVDVTFGGPLLFQMKVEKIIRDATDDSSFSFEKFLTDEMYAQYWIDKYETIKINFNLLDVIHTVPHYKAMFTVPIQFKYAMQLLAKDMDLVHKIAYNKLAPKYKIDESVLRSLLRIINDRKVFSFLLDVPFEYKTQTHWKQINNANQVEQVIEDKPIILSTKSMDGMISLKPYIENIIIPEIKKRYPDNRFAINLKYNSIYNPLFRERIRFVGSGINLTDSQYEDIVAIIKNHFYAIQNDVINEHSIYEWMFIYDLIINKHDISSNSISPLLDGKMNLSDDNSIVSKWVKYINQYDKSSSTYDIPEMKHIPNLKDINNSSNASSLDFMYDPNMEDPLIDYMGKRRPVGFIDPNILPFFVSADNFGVPTILHRNELYNAFGKGIVTFKLC